MLTTVTGVTMCLFSAVVFIRNLGPTLRKADARFRCAAVFVTGVYMIGSVVF